MVAWWCKTGILTQLNGPLFSYTPITSPDKSGLTNAFKRVGYNILHIVLTGRLGDTLFPFDNLTNFIDLALWLMYDARWNRSNLTLMMEQPVHINTRKSLLLYYTADDLDGQTEPLNATKSPMTPSKPLIPTTPSLYARIA